MANRITWQFELAMYLLAGLFWVLGLIPFVNIVTNTIYWMIWTGVFLYKYLPLIKDIAKTGISVGFDALKIGAVVAMCAILGEIPIVSWGPWNVISQWYTHRTLKKIIKKMQKIKENMKKLAQGYNETVRQPLAARRRDQELEGERIEANARMARDELAGEYETA